MPKRLTVVISQGQSQNPAKRDLEENLVAALLMEHGLDVTVIPHLYDLQPDGTGILALQGISGDMVVLAWLFERAARWTLDRHDIRGQEGVTLVKPADDDEDDDEDEAEEDAPAAEEKERVIDSRPLPPRKIYCLDLRIHNTAQPYIDEIKRIYQEVNTKVVELSGWLNGSPTAPQLARFESPTNNTALGLAPAVGQAASLPTDAGSFGHGSTEAGSFGHGSTDAGSFGHEAASVVRIEEEPARRWYPVIDFSRCTNCMECIDFCLFGVYGVDSVETILVEQPDNCRKGCPACSRVCPENAIIFPQHKTPAIAGSPEAVGGLKIDLSQLFGAPEQGASAVEVAARERDEQLVLAGREAVGLSVGIPKRQEGKSAAPKDELDSLLDQLDEMDL